jgi:hypothetical protein
LRDFLAALALCAATILLQRSKYDARTGLPFARPVGSGA